MPRVSHRQDSSVQPPPCNGNSFEIDWSRQHCRRGLTNLHSLQSCCDRSDKRTFRWTKITKNRDSVAAVSASVVPVGTGGLCSALAHHHAPRQ